MANSYTTIKDLIRFLDEVAYNYNLIKDMSFPESKGDHIYVKDLSNHSKPNYSNEQVCFRKTTPQKKTDILRYRELEIK